MKINKTINRKEKKFNEYHQIKKIEEKQTIIHYYYYSLLYIYILCTFITNL